MLSCLHQYNIIRTLLKHWFKAFKVWIWITTQVLIKTLKWKTSSKTPIQHSYFRKYHLLNRIYIVRCMIVLNCGRKWTRWLIVMSSFSHLPYIVKNWIYHYRVWFDKCLCHVTKRMGTGHYAINRGFYLEVEWRRDHQIPSCFLGKWTDQCWFNEMQEILRLAIAKQCMTIVLLGNDFLYAVEWIVHVLYKWINI